jgi:hypothetical protein
MNQLQAVAQRRTALQEAVAKGGNHRRKVSMAEWSQNLMQFPIIAEILLAATFACGMPQSQFAGKWKTRVSRISIGS